MLALTLTSCRYEIPSGLREKLDSTYQKLASPQKLSAAPDTDAECTYGKPTACAPEKICAHPDHAESASKLAYCFDRYAGATPFLNFPFSPGTVVYCTQGIETPAGEHSEISSLFALDLSPSSDEKNNLKVYSATEGVALTYIGCTDQKEFKATGQERIKQCDQGFGTHVRVLRNDGLFVLYANLAEIFVQDGQPIHIGDVIGLVGTSGREKSRHLHLSVHFRKPENWLETLAYFRTHPGEVPPSIPFETQYCDPQFATECHRLRTRMNELPCGTQSKLPLKADWRK